MKHFQCTDLGQVTDVPGVGPKPLDHPQYGARAAMIHRLNNSPSEKRRGEPIGNALRHNFPFFSLVCQINIGS